MSDIITLLERYAAATNATIESVDDKLLSFRPAEGELKYFGAPERILALDVESIDLHPDAEMAVIGSGFAEDLLTAIRERGTRLDRGFLKVTASDHAGAEAPSVTVRRGHLVDESTESSWIPLGRLYVKASVRTGNHVQDHLLATGLFDLSSGEPMDVEISHLETHGMPGSHDQVPIGALDEMFPRMLEDIEETLLDEIAGAMVDANSRLKRELQRLDRYYEGIISELTPGSNREATIRRYRQDHERRKAEEMERYRTRAELRPVQLEIVYGLAQRYDFRLLDDGVDAWHGGRKLLFGQGKWSISCPTCHEESPDLWAVCSDGHVVCSTCTTACSLCGTTTCERHGGGACSPGEHAICEEHGLTCGVCSGRHCSEHQGTCRLGDHLTCNRCIEICDACGVEVCTAHSHETLARHGLGARTVCEDCLRYCRGQKTEPLGLDEVELCQTCGTDVCYAHLGRCGVDEAIHCQRHLVKTDRSRREVCEAHRARCHWHTELLFASDEVWPCAECGNEICEEHTVRCYADDGAFCGSHMVRLADGSYSCPEHYGQCWIDQAAFRLDQIDRCPICSKGACAGHREKCSSCAREVCTGDWDGRGWLGGLCRTCDQLAEDTDPSTDMIQAFSDLADAKWGRPVEWETGRDSTHRVARVSLSKLGRKVVFCKAHRSGEVTHMMLDGLIRKVRVV